MKISKDLVPEDIFSHDKALAMEEEYNELELNSRKYL